MTVAMDAMAVAIHIKYALSLNRHLTFYLPVSVNESSTRLHAWYTSLWLVRHLHT